MVLLARIALNRHEEDIALPAQAGQPRLFPILIRLAD